MMPSAYDLAFVAVHELLPNLESRYEAPTVLAHVPLLRDLSCVLLIRHRVEDRLLREARWLALETGFSNQLKLLWPGRPEEGHGLNGVRHGDAQQLSERTSVKPTGLAASVYLVSMLATLAALIEPVNGQCLTRGRAHFVAPRRASHRALGSRDAVVA